MRCSTRSTQTSPTFFRQISENDSPAIFFFPTKNLRRNSNSLNPSSPFRSLLKLKYNAAIALLLSFCTASILVRSYCHTGFPLRSLMAVPVEEAIAALSTFSLEVIPHILTRSFPFNSVLIFGKFCLNFLPWYNFNCDLGV